MSQVELGLGFDNFKASLVLSIYRNMNNREKEKVSRKKDRTSRSSVVSIISVQSS